MSPGKQAYEDRKRRKQMDMDKMQRRQDDRDRREEKADAVVELALDGIRAFFEGSAGLVISKNSTTGDVHVKFVKTS
jgi:hypothetical protein